MGKVRRVDFYPDELISGVAGKLSVFDFGIYWMVCTLIASRGGPIDNDPEWLSSLFQKRTKTRDVSASIARLIEAEKLHQSGGKLSQKRMQSEVKRASDRIAKYRENGSKGGRPRKENSNLEKPSGFSDENLPATTNHQPPTTETNTVPSERAPDEPAPPAASPDLKAEVFGRGLAWLAEKSGKPEAKLRPLVGKWCRDHGDGRVFEVLCGAARASPVDPIPWITQALTNEQRQVDATDIALRLLETA
ncbi:MAG: hypothetical protein ACTS10_21925 [Kiloniellales bacterium]